MEMHFKKIQTNFFWEKILQILKKRKKKKKQQFFDFKIAHL